jgi:hypothetical protein
MFKKLKKNPEKAQIWAWEPIEGFNVEPRFFSGFTSKFLKV